MHNNNANQSERNWMTMHTLRIEEIVSYIYICIANCYELHSRGELKGTAHLLRNGCQ